MRETTANTSKVATIAAKHQLIVEAARESFLRDGFAVSSMDSIAKAAGVSVKTIYSHFENKNTLFSEVMVAACTDHLFSDENPSEEKLSARFPWFYDFTQRGLAQAGRQYLEHLLSEEQLALYRVVTRDADRFPELGRQYQTHVAQGRTRILIAYFRSLNRSNTWNKRNTTEDAALYEAMLRAGIYEEALHALSSVTVDLIDKHAHASSKKMWKWLASNS